MKTCKDFENADSAIKNINKILTTPVLLKETSTSTSNFLFNLYQFFKLKYLYGRKRSCVGSRYSIFNIKDAQGNPLINEKTGKIRTRISHDVPEYVTLEHTCNVLKKYKGNIDTNYYFELILQYYSISQIRTFLSNFDEGNVLLSDKSKTKNIYEQFVYLKENDKLPQILKHFMFYELNDNYKIYESEIANYFFKQFEYRNNLKIVRG